MSEWKLYKKQIVIDGKSIFLIPTMAIERFDKIYDKKGWSIEFHFLMLHGGLLFLESEVAGNE